MRHLAVIPCLALCFSGLADAVDKPQALASVDTDRAMDALMK